MCSIFRGQEVNYLLKQSNYFDKKHTKFLSSSVKAKNNINHDLRL